MEFTKGYNTEIIGKVYSMAYTLPYIIKVRNKVRR